VNWRHISSTISRCSAAESRSPRPTSSSARAPCARTPGDPTGSLSSALVIQAAASSQRPSRNADCPRRARSELASPSAPHRPLSTMLSSATLHASSRSPAQWSASTSSIEISAAPAKSATERASDNAPRRVSAPEAASPTATALRPMQPSARISASAEPTSRAFASACSASRFDSSKWPCSPSAWARMPSACARGADGGAVGRSSSARLAAGWAASGLPQPRWYAASRSSRGPYRIELGSRFALERCLHKADRPIVCAGQGGRLCRPHPEVRKRHPTD
jgi:hypothetical protein